MLRPLNRQQQQQRQWQHWQHWQQAAIWGSKRLLIEFHFISFHTRKVFRRTIWLIKMLQLRWQFRLDAWLLPVVIFVPHTHSHTRTHTQTQPHTHSHTLSFYGEFHLAGDKNCTCGARRVPKLVHFSMSGVKKGRGTRPHTWLNLQFAVLPSLSH